VPSSGLEKIYKIAVSINDSIAKITSVGIKKVSQLLWESARVHNVNTEVCDHGPCKAILSIKRQESIVAFKTTL
jgi:hypothetical protein